MRGAPIPARASRIARLVFMLVPLGAAMVESGCDDGARANIGGAAGATINQGGHAGKGGSAGGTNGAAGAGGANGAGGATVATAPAWQWTVACPDGHDPTSPLDYGRCAIDQALAEAAAAASNPSTPPKVTLATATDAAARAALPDALATLDLRGESFVIIPAVGGATGAAILGRDDVGAMYGALELAERVRLAGLAGATPASVVRGAAAVAFRAANLFWTTKAADEKDWWFLDEAFWRQYLDLLAHARMDVLDIHAMYDPSTTVFPNALVYLAHSTSFPDVGLPLGERDRNVLMMNRIITMARARGVRVGLMTYQASSTVDGRGTDPLDDASVQIYDREAAADVAARIPGLAMLGFRIGESGRPATWYIDSIVAGVKQAGTGLPLYTRTWRSSKDEIAALAAAIGPGMLLEAKYNGEQLAAPYAIAGGVFGTTYEPSYSYQNYLTPPAPWSFVFQVRAAGTHRIFRNASYERTRRTVMSLGALSPNIAGFTLEPPHAYAQQRDDYHATAADRVSPWTFARDDLMYLLWGRLGYDPATPESTFRAIAANEAGTDRLWDAMQAASDIVPWIQTAHTCGPDSRDFEPEMELGGDVAQWADEAAKADNCPVPGPFDTFAVASPRQAAGALVSGLPDGRLSPIDVAAQVTADVDRVEAALRAAAAGDGATLTSNILARDLVRESQALADLGRHFAHKLRAATALGVYAQTATPAWLATARAETETADAAWRKLADDTGYLKPFPERLRMAGLGYDPFHWSKVLPALDADHAALDAVMTKVAAAPTPTTRALPAPDAWVATPRTSGPGLAALTVTPAVAKAASWDVNVRFGSAVPAGATVHVLWKPFDSQSDWTSMLATVLPDGSFGASVAGGGAGALFAVELASPTGAWRYPDPLVATPYVSVAP